MQLWVETQLLRNFVQHRSKFVVQWGSRSDWIVNHNLSCVRGDWSNCGSANLTTGQFYSSWAWMPISVGHKEIAHMWHSTSGSYKLSPPQAYIPSNSRAFQCWNETEDQAGRCLYDDELG